MKRASSAAASRATDRLLSAKRVCGCDEAVALQKEVEPIRRLQAWAKADPDRYFEVRYIASIKHPWAVEVSNDSVSWSVTADTHDSLDHAVAHALAKAEQEERALDQR